MKIYAGHAIGTRTLTADLQFFKRDILDFGFEVAYDCPALGWTVWVSRASNFKERMELCKKFDYLVTHPEGVAEDVVCRLTQIVSL